MQCKKIRIGSRSSKLAMIQTTKVIDAIKDIYKNIDIEIVPISTLGDKKNNVPISNLGGKGVFTKEIENALMSKDIDLAVHSAKDMSVYVPKGLTVSSALKREEPIDIIISKEKARLNELSKGSKIGTGSLRRSIFALEKNSYINIMDIRGNIETRVSKLLYGEYDAIILAKAGINRLNDPDMLKDLYVEEMDINTFIPSACQGILAVEYRKDDLELKQILSEIIDKDTQLAFEVERAFLREIQAGCNEPCAVYCEIQDSVKVKIHAMYKADKLNIVREVVNRNTAVEKSMEIGRRITNK